MDELVAVEWEAANLRQAVSLADFSLAEAAAARYTTLLATALSQKPPAEAAQAVEDACALLEWARRNLCASRASLAGRLSAASRAARYTLHAGPSPAISIRG